MNNTIQRYVPSSIFKVNIGEEAEKEEEENREEEGIRLLKFKVLFEILL